MAPIYQDFDQLYGHLAPEAQAAVELDKKLLGPLAKCTTSNFKILMLYPTMPALR
jgi:hypothetical protein